MTDLRLVLGQRLVASQRLGAAVHHLGAAAADVAAGPPPQVDPKTPGGAHALSVWIFRARASAAAAAGEHQVADGMRTAASELEAAPIGTAADVYALAFDLAVRLEAPGHTSKLAESFEKMREEHTDAIPWVQLPDFGDFTRPDLWWARRVATFLVASGNPDRAQHEAALLKTARELLEGTAWTTGKPAGEAKLLQLYTWALEQSPLPLEAAQTRAFLAQDAKVARYVPKSDLQRAAEGAAKPFEQAADAVKKVADSVQKSPKTWAVGVGLAAAGVGALLFFGPALAPAAAGALARSRRKA